MGDHKEAVAQGQSTQRRQSWEGLQQVLGAVCLPAARGLAGHALTKASQVGVQAGD